MSNAGSPPCCCMTLESGSRLVGFVQIIWSILATIWFTVVIVQAGNVLQSQGYTYGGGAYALFAIVYIAYLTKLVTGIILMFGSFQRNLGKCNIWFYATLVLLVLEVILTIVSLSGRVVPWDTLIGIGLEVYFLWVVHAFIQELKNGLGIHV